MKKPKVTFNSPVVLIFVAACFVVTLLGTLTNGATTQVLNKRK